MSEVHGCGLADIGGKPCSKAVRIVCVDPRVMLRTRNRDVGQPGIDKRPARIGVDVCDNPALGESLRDVGRDGIAVVEVPHLRRVKLNGALGLAVHLDGNLSGFELCDGA